MDLSKLKKNSDLSNLTKKLEEQAQAKSYNDERYWQPTVDKAKNGSAVIRLLPTSPSDLELNEDALPFVKYYDHNFKGPGGWYIEKCLTTLGQADPCAEENNRLWNTKIEANQNLARNRKRNTRYISNVLVVSDPNNPETEGNVYLFRYGPKLYEKFQAAMAGDEDTAGFNPWDFWEGANFRIKIKTTKDNKTGNTFRNYDDSKFAPCSVVATDEDELTVIWQKEYSLAAEIAADKFKPYTELKVQLNKVLARPAPEDVVENEATAEAEPIEVVEPKSKRTPVQQPKEEVITPPWEEVGEEDTTLAMFQKLAGVD